MFITAAEDREIYWCKNSYLKLDLFILTVEFQLSKLINAEVVLLGFKVF